MRFIKSLNSLNLTITKVGVPSKVQKGDSYKVQSFKTACFFKRTLTVVKIKKNDFLGKDYYNKSVIMILSDVLLSQQAYHDWFGNWKQQQNKLGDRG